MPLIKHFVSNNKLLYSADHYRGETSNVDVISTCFFLISSETLKKINFMDDKVFLYYEDFILCKKVADLKLDVVICNEVKVKHLYSVSVDKNYKSKKKRLMLRDSMLYYHSTYHDINFIQKKLLKMITNTNIFLSKKR